MHDREILETFRDLLKLFETFKSQKLHEFDEILYGKYELLHGKDEILQRKDEVLWHLRRIYFSLLLEESSFKRRI